MTKSLLPWSVLISGRLPKRLRVMRVGNELFSLMFVGSTHMYSTDAPTDLRVVGFRPSVENDGCIELLVWSNVFDEVPDDVWSLGSETCFPELVINFRTYYPEESPR